MKNFKIGSKNYFFEDDKFEGKTPISDLSLYHFQRAKTYQFYVLLINDTKATRAILFGEGDQLVDYLKANNVICENYNLTQHKIKTTSERNPDLRSETLQAITEEGYHLIIYTSNRFKQGYKKPCFVHAWLIDKEGKRKELFLRYKTDKAVLTGLYKVKAVLLKEVEKDSEEAQAIKNKYFHSLQRELNKELTEAENNKIFGYIILIISVLFGLFLIFNS
ncbi:hypothetical protein [Mesonia mobilis]|uniref:hypothetical protein n=2 Tax=Mesonia mobilis TaxID=369791 RepID=UPI0026E93940|nr:hypothetical protein [Mesonia mobilis]